MRARARNWALYVGGAGAGSLLLYLLLPHLGPLVLGLLLAVLIDRPVSALERRGIRRGLGALLVLAGGFLGTAALAGWLGVALYAEVRELALVLPAGPGAVPSAAGVPQGSQPWLDPLPPLLRALGQRAVESLYAAAGQWVEGVVRAVARLPSLLWPLAVATLFAYFASRDRRALAAATMRYVPLEWRRRAARLRGRILSHVAAFLHAQVLIVSLSAALSSAALLALGSPYALSLGLLAGILDLIPFLGPGVVFGTLAGVRLLQSAPGEGVAAAVAGLVVFGARQWVETYLVAGRTQLHPLTVVVSLYLGSRLLGATGFLVGPVIALTAKAFLAERNGSLPWR